MSASHERREDLLPAAAITLADHRRVRAAARAIGAATWINRGAAGPYVLAAGMALLIYMLFGWFGTVIPGKRSRSVQQAGRRLVSLGDGLVHLLGDDVLRAHSSARCSTCGGMQCRIWRRATPASYGRASREAGRQRDRASRAR